MTIAEIISALMKYSEEDYLILVRTMDEIKISGNKIFLYFTDANTFDVAIDKDGKETEWE